MPAARCGDLYMRALNKQPSYAKLGPYTYLKNNTKVDVSFEDDGNIVSYRKRRFAGTCYSDIDVNTDSTILCRSSRKAPSLI